MVISAVVREHVSAQMEGVRICESGGWYETSGQLCRACLPSQVVGKGLVLPSMPLSLLVCYEITESQNSRGWKGPLWVF